MKIVLLIYLTLGALYAAMNLYSAWDLAEFARLMGGRVKVWKMKFFVGLVLGMILWLPVLVACTVSMKMRELARRRVYDELNGKKLR